MRTNLAGLCLLLLCTLASAQHNVIIMVADDMGVDLVGAYGEHPSPGHTPVIDGLAAGGILFRNAWADPVCSPTRSTVLTGRHGFRTGLGRAINDVDDRFELPVEEVTLPEILAPTYSSAAIGKWHLSTYQLHGLQHPQLTGFQHHRGSMSIFPGFINDDFYSYDKAVDGVLTHSAVYATTDTVDDCLAMIDSFPEPWFIWLAFNAPHAPFHKPPANLHTFTLPGPIVGNIPIHVKAMTEAMDTEIGRLLATMAPAVLANTVVIFVGDNGTDKNATTLPFISTKAKGTVYEGGVNVPLIINGPGVAAGAECAGLVCTTDLFATVADIAGVSSTTGTDSVSLLPYFTQPSLPSLRSTVYAEFYLHNGFVAKDEWRRAVRGERYKLITMYDALLPPAVELLFDLQVDPFENVNLLAGTLTQEQQDAYTALSAAMASHYEPWGNLGHGLAGIDGIPQLVGTGAPIDGNLVSLTLDDARPDAPATLIVGLSSITFPFKGGIMGPAPDTLISGLVTDSGGSLVLSATWPPGIPAGTSVFYQYWISDPAGPLNLSSSNTVASLTPL